MGRGALEEMGACSMAGQKHYLRRKCVSGDLKLASTQLLRPRSFDKGNSTLGRSFKLDAKNLTVLWFPTSRKPWGGATMTVFPFPLSHRSQTQLFQIVVRVSGTRGGTERSSSV